MELEHERANLGIDMFSAISEMSDPEELKLLVLENPDFIENNKEKYKAVYELICKCNGDKK